MPANDAEATERVADAFRGHFPAERVRQTGPVPASEDFGSFGTEWRQSPVAFITMISESKLK